MLWDYNEALIVCPQFPFQFPLKLKADTCKHPYLCLCCSHYLFFLLFPNMIELEDLIRGPVWLPVCKSTSCFFWPCSSRLCSGCCLSPVCMQPSECWSWGLLGCLFVLSFIMPFFLTAIVARQECAIACCRLLEGEGPITWGPSAWLQL